MLTKIQKMIFKKDQRSSASLSNQFIFKNPELVYQEIAYAKESDKETRSNFLDIIKLVMEN